MTQGRTARTATRIRRGPIDPPSSSSNMIPSTDCSDPKKSHMFERNDTLPYLTLNGTIDAIPHPAEEDAIRPPPIFVGPTPLNSPIGQAPFHDTGQVDMQGNRQSHRNTGAIVAPSSYFPPVPLSEDYVEEHEGGLIATAVEIINTARDLFGVIIGSPGRMGRSWYESH